MKVVYFIPALAAALVPACRKSEQPAQGGGAPPPPAVEFVHPVEKEIIAWNRYTGRMEAIQDVEVRARVGGLLEEIHFDDGDLVERGAPLFSLDPKPFEAALEAARAELEQAKASEKLAESNFERGKQLLERNAISKEEVDIRAGDFAVAESRVQASEARVRSAELDLGYTEVRAPIAGRVSDNFVSVGNLISGGSAESTLLTTIVSIDPIYCRIEIDDGSVLKYLRRAQAGGEEPRRIPAQLGLGGEEGYPREGYIDFVDNTFDPGTATLRARAIFENEDEDLAPGMFARVRLPGRGEFTATLVPERAIQTQQNITSVLTLDEDDTVRMTRVTLGPTHNGDMRVIESELSTDERVIVSGITAARPGEKADPRPAETGGDPADGAPDGASE